MSTIPLLCCFLVLLPLSISLGRCSNISFSLCWFNNNEGSESESFNIWLNGTALGSIGTEDKLTSLTVYPGVKNTLTLQYGDIVHSWAFTLNQRSRNIKVNGLVKPNVRPTQHTQSFLQMWHPSKVFACENGSLFFHQKHEFFLAIGYTSRLPVKLESRSASMLLLSWRVPHSPPSPAESHSVELYTSELDSFSPVRLETTTDVHHRFTGLDSCAVYIACVEIVGTDSLTCLSTLTDPEKPRDLEVWSVNSSSLTLTWDCPENRRFSVFLLTVFYLDGVTRTAAIPHSHQIHSEEERHWIQEPLEWTLSDLPPCSRFSFGLQTVCVSGAETRYSPMVLHQGNSDQSNILKLAQSSSGPEHYSLSWEVGTQSSVSKFRVLHDGKEQGTTLKPSFMMSGLQPCQTYTATVQALCGAGTVMDTQTLRVHTVPRGVSDLSFLPNDSIAVWTPGTEGSEVAFVFKLSREDEKEELSGSVSEPRLPLSGLQRALLYHLSVWEECGVPGQSQRNTVVFTPESNEVVGRAARPNVNRSQDFLDSINDLALIVPWTLPEELQDRGSDPWAQMATILQDRMERMLRGYNIPVHVELMTSGPVEETGHTEYVFSFFHKRVNVTTDEAVPSQLLRIQHDLEYVWSLLLTNGSSIKDGVLHWEGPDLCLSSPCPQNSLCLNTLDSFRCLCRQDHYDVRAFVKKPEVPNSPVCHDKGLFSRCLDKQLVGGISKLYLSSHLQGVLHVSLNQGKCPVNESEDFYHFKTSRNGSHCGTRRWVNETHIELQNTLTVSGGGWSRRRRQMKVVLKCVYPRHYLRSALVGLDLDWVSSVSVVAYNSSLLLDLSMRLFGDHSYSSSYSDTVMLGPEDNLFFEVSLQTSHSYVQDIRLQVDSCWATESSDPNEQVQGVILQDGCPNDDTFSWLLENGGSQKSRFSVQMFQMPLGLPLYFHCRAAVCGPHDNCTKICSSEPRRKRAVTIEAPAAAVVSAGPLVVTKGRTSRGEPSHWAEHMTVITAVAGTIGFLAVTLLFVSAAKAVMNYYERLKLQ